MAQDLPTSFSEHERTRLETLAAMIDLFRQFPKDSTQKQFSNLFAWGQLVLELDDVELAQMFRVSRPTIGRWARGDSAPHPIGRKAVFDSLCKVAKAKLKHHKGEAAERVAAMVATV